jgi:hypothetical protein
MSGRDKSANEPERTLDVCMKEEVHGIFNLYTRIFCFVVA